MLGLVGRELGGCFPLSPSVCFYSSSCSSPGELPSVSLPGPIYLPLLLWRVVKMAPGPVVVLAIFHALPASSFTTMLVEGGEEEAWFSDFSPPAADPAAAQGASPHPGLLPPPSNLTDVLATTQTNISPSLPTVEPSVPPPPNIFQRLVCPSYRALSSSTHCPLGFPTCSCSLSRCCAKTFHSCGSGML